MAFWGIEVRSGKPGTLCFRSDKGRFHLTQATLSASAENTSRGSFVQCNVGDNPGVLICSLFPGRTDMCSLNLEFDEDEEVVFSVLGPNSVHLCGFFEELNPDEYGEDITQESSEDEEEEEDEELSDDVDGFIVKDDDDSEEDAMIVSPGAVPNSGVKIEEIRDEVEAEKEGTQKPKKKKDKKKKKKEEDEKNDGISENNGTEKEEGDGEGPAIDGDNGEEGVAINGKRKKKSKENVEGEAEAETEPPTKKQATEEAVIGVTEAAEVKTSKKKKKKKSKNKA